MNISEILKKYTYSVNQAKFNIFSPTYRTEGIKYEEVMFENEFFKVKLTGYKLSQLHRDILDIALYEGDNSIEKIVKEPIVARTFSLYHMQKKLEQNKEIKQIIEDDKKRKKKYTNNNWLERKIKELKRATINIEIKLNNTKKIWLEFNIIRVATMLNSGDNNPRNKKFLIAFTKEFLTFLESDILIDYRNYLDDILKLKTGQAKALARYVISFKNNFSESLESIMEKIGIGRNKFKNRKTFNEHRNRILSDLEELKKLNIEIIKIKKGEHLVRYKKLDNIDFFYNKKEKRIIPSSPAEFLLPYIY